MEKKTAEEILRLYPALHNFTIKLSDVEVAAVQQAMREFASQELTEYKTKLKQRIEWLLDDGQILNLPLLKKQIDSL